MRRDMEIVRTILRTVESRSEEENDDILTIEGIDNQIVWGHVELLADASLVEAQISRHAGLGILFARVLRMTWAGHDFLDAIRSDTVWNKTKAKLTETGVGWTFELVKSLATSYGKQLLGAVDSAQ